ncbi:MAG: FAD-dependent monooxygenase, partial [Ferruginibacter sp.]
MDKVYDTAIIGGGLGGLTLSIQLVRAGLTVILLEKEQYPFNKVCGEYISMESWDFLISLGLPLKAMQLPRINQLKITSPSGNTLHTTLGLGGFGISRYTIDNELKNIAVASGVIVLENCKAEAPVFKNEIFTISTNNGL